MRNPQVLRGIESYAGGMASREDIVSAQLNGSALYHVDEKTPRDEAIAILREKATLDRRVRVDLLEDAAAGLLGVYLSGEPRIHPRHRPAVDLLVAAGADLERVKELAEPVRARLAASYAPGIGNPGRRPPGSPTPGIRS